MRFLLSLKLHFLPHRRRRLPSQMMTYRGRERCKSQNYLQHRSSALSHEWTTRQQSTQEEEEEEGQNEDDDDFNEATNKCIDRWGWLANWLEEQPQQHNNIKGIWGEEEETIVVSLLIRLRGGGSADSTTTNDDETVLFSQPVLLGCNFFSLPNAIKRTTSSEYWVVATVIKESPH